MPEITAFDRNGEEHKLTGDSGVSVMETLRDAGLPIEAACGGCCSCATCHIFVDPKWRDAVGGPADTERELLSMSDHFNEAASRLSCQITLSDDLDGMVVTLAPED